MTEGRDRRAGNPRVFKGQRAKQLWKAMRRLVAERERRAAEKKPKRD